MEEESFAGAPMAVIMNVPTDDHAYQSDYGHAEAAGNTFTRIINIGGGSSSSMYSTSNLMDSRIWRRVPQRLMDRIIACLPPPAFFRARSVCKRWYGLLFSAAFQELYLQVSPRRHWFLFFRRPKKINHIYCCSSNDNNNNDNNDMTMTREGFLLDPESLKWYRWSFPTAVIPPGLCPASSSGGLLCWVSEDAGCKNVVLCNPLLLVLNNISTGGCLIQLPSTLRPRLCPSVGLTVTHSSVHLTFAGDDMISPYAVKNLTSESFHIDTGGFYSIWGTTAPLPRLCSSSGPMIHVSGHFYCMNFSPFSVLAYDISANHWTKIQAPMRRFLRSPTLVESQGRLVLVATVEKRKLNVPKSLRMWALQDNVWMEIERMPQQLYLQFSEMECGRGFDCVAHGDSVVLILNNVRAELLLLLFDMSRKRWSWIPPCPRPGAGTGREEDDVEHYHELQGFAYEPRLAVPVTPLLNQLTLPFQSFTT